MFLPALITLMMKHDSVDDRVEAALRKLPLERKLEMIGGYDGFDIMPVPELGLHKMLMNDGPLGVRGDNESRPSMAYPAGVCLASAFNPNLDRAFGEAVGRDANGRGVSILLGPGVNLARIPQNGRNFEYVGEDPFLASRTAVNMIEGLQSQGIVATIKHFAANNHEEDRTVDSSDVSERALRELYLRAFEAAVKEAHVGAVMCSYNKLNGTYTSENSWLLQQVLRKEWGFKGILMSDWGAVHSMVGAALHGMDLEMPGPDNFDPKKLTPLVASGKIPESVIDDKIRHILHTVYTYHMDKPLGKYVHDDPRNATVARHIAEEGIVLLKNDRHALPLNPAKKESVAVLGFNALEPVPVGGGSAEILPLHKESLLDALRRTPLKLYPLEPPAPDVEKALAFKGFNQAELDFWSVEGKQSYRRFKDGLTTYDWTTDHPSPVGMGDFMGQVRATYRPKASGMYWLVSRCQGKVDVGLSWGHWASHSDESKLTTIEQQVFLYAGQEVEVNARFHHRAGAMHIAFGLVPADSPLQSSAAMETLRNADRVIMGVGFNPYLEGEGIDRPFDLPLDQRVMLEVAIKMKKRIILVVNSGAGVNLAPYVHHVDAIIQAWYPGEEGAKALAEILTGQVNPSGKLATTFPVSLDGTYYAKAYPPKNHHLNYREDLLIGYRWFDTIGKSPLFPFGFGLSYTTFSIRQSAAKLQGDAIAVTARLRNTGNRAGADVVQVYAGPKKPASGLPLKELKGFSKVKLAAGAAKKVQIQIPLKSLAHWDTQNHCWRVAMGNYVVYVGDSSRNVTAIPVGIGQEIVFAP